MATTTQKETSKQDAENTKGHSLHVKKNNMADIFTL